MKKILWLIIFLSIISGCSKQNNNQEIPMDKVINQNISYIQSADLLVTGDFDFGTVSQNISNSKIITIKNTGTTAGKVKIDLTTIFQTNGIFSINYNTSDCFVSGSYKILQPQYSCQIEMLLNSGTASGAIFAAIPLYDELAANTLIKNLQASVVISSTGSTPPVGKTCITAYHKDPIANKCVSDYKDCSPLITNSIVAKKHWNSISSTFDACLASSCVPSYSPANGGTSCALSQQTITINKLINQGISNVYDSGTNVLIGSCPVGSISCNILAPALSNIRIESIGTTGYSFSNYTDSNCLGTNFTCNKNNISTNLIINPLFSIQNYTLSFTVLPSYDSSNVTYTILKNGVACSTPACLSSFNFGQTVQITATPDSYVSTSSITLSDASRSPTGVNPISFIFGTANITATINLTDKSFSTQPTLSFTNGSLSGSNVTTSTTTLNLITTNPTVAREMMISNTSDCSVGSYETYATPKVYNVIPNVTSPLSVIYRNGTSLSTCKVYSIIPQNRTRDCSPQPTNSSTNGIQTSTNAGTSWSACSGFTCLPNYVVSGSSCVLKTQACLITNGTGLQTWSIASNNWGTCQVTSCGTGYYTTNLTSCQIKPCSEYMNGTELAFMGISLTGSSGFLFGTVYPNCTLASCSLGYTLASGSKSCVDLTAPIISISGGATTSDNTKSPTYTLTNIEDGVGLNYNYIELKNSAGTVLATLNDPTTLLSKSYQFTGLTLTEADTYSINAYSMDLSLNKSNTATLSFNYVAPKKLAFQVYSPSSQIYSGSSTNYTTNELIYSVSLTNTIAPLFTMNSINSTPITTNSSLAAISQMKPVFSHNGYLFFVAYDTRGAFTSSYGADYQIFQTDGTATGSARVSINLNFNINSTFANGAYVLSLSSFTSKNFIVYNNKPYFVNLNDAAKNYLFSLTPATVSGKSIYSANGVWDLQNSATNLQFAQITPGFFDKQIVEYNGKLYSSFSCELGAYDGATFVILKDLFTGNDAISTTRANCGSPQNFLKYNGKLYFSAQNSSNWGLMSTDGTSAGTTMVKSMGTVHSGQLVGSSSHANNLVVHNNYLYFVGGSSSSTSAVYKSDGTTAGTNIVTTFGTTGSNMTIQYLSTCNNKLYYYFYNSVLATYTIGILDSATGIGVNGGATSLSNGSYITGTGDFACYNNEFYYLDSVSKTIRKSDGVGGFSTAITLNTNSTVNMAAYNGYLYYGDLTNTTDARRTLYIYNGATTIPSVGVLAPTYFVEY